ncbi:MAG: hypothetical protein IPI78_14950 [Chitinophagaceae bacterium]|nr:hypothetical protein [Chitinophagaceae bacterium]
MERMIMRCRITVTSGVFGELVLVQAFYRRTVLSLLHKEYCNLVPTNWEYRLTRYYLKRDYKLFPNPTVGPFEVDFFVKTPGFMSLQLINTMGQILESRSYHYDGCCRIELFDLAVIPTEFTS